MKRQKDGTTKRQRSIKEFNIVMSGQFLSFIKLLLVVDRHKLTVFYLKSFDMDSVQVGKAVFVKEIYTTL